MNERITFGMRKLSESAPTARDWPVLVLPPEAELIGEMPPLGLVAGGLDEGVVWRSELQEFRRRPSPDDLWIPLSELRAMRAALDQADRQADQRREVLRLGPKRVEAGAKDCLWTFPQYDRVRPLRLTWEGPAQVIYQGYFWGSPLTLDAVIGRGVQEVELGNPLCFVVQNPTDRPLEVELAVECFRAATGFDEQE